MDSTSKKKQLAKLQTRIKYDEDIFESKDNYEQLLDDLLEDSFYIALSILYPFEDFAEYELPTRYFNWQIRCCVELYHLAGKANISSYSENGLAWSMFKSGLSQDLLNELTPRVGTPRIKATYDNESESEE